MGWFDEQIRLRKKNDEQVFEDSFKLIGDAVYGKGANKTKDSFVLTNEALENILKFYGLKMGDIPKEITDINERIEYVCRPNGIMYRRVKLTPSWYKDAIGAMLAFDKETDMPIALIPNVIKGYCFIKDGKIIKVNNKNENIIKEDAYCFYKPFPLRKISPLDLIKYAIKNDIKIISSMGAGNKIDPNKAYITDIWKTSNDPLAKKIRTILRKEKINYKLPVVSSLELPSKSSGDISSICLVPNTFGILLVSYVLNDIIKNN